MAEVVDQAFEFGTCQRIVGFDRMAANRFRTVLSPNGWMIACRIALSSSTNSETKRRASDTFTKAQGHPAERAVAELAQPDAKPTQRFQLFAQELRVARQRSIVSGRSNRRDGASLVPRAGASSARTRLAHAPRADPAGRVRDPIPARHRVVQSRPPDAAGYAAADTLCAKVRRCDIRCRQSAWRHARRN